MKKVELLPTRDCEAGCGPANFILNLSTIPKLDSNFAKFHVLKDRSGKKLKFKHSF